MASEEINNTSYKNHSFITVDLGWNDKCVIYADDIIYYDTWNIGGIPTKMFQIIHRCMARTNNLNKLLSLSFGYKHYVFAENRIRPSNDDEIKSLIKAIKFKEGFAKHIKFDNDHHLYHN